MIKPIDFKAELVRKEKISTKVYSFVYKPLEVEFNFEPGQFVMVKFAGPEKPETRSYSIASAPGKPEFELCVEVIEGGLGSNYLANVEVGQTVEFKGPFGMSTLKEDNKNDLIMVATGTGIAPIKSILEDLANKKDTRNIDVLFGVRFYEDLFYLKELKDLAEKLEGSNIMLTLSKPNDLWTGHTGRVTDHLTHLDISNNPDIYICGNGNMIKDVRDWALAAGIEKKKIHLEIFN